MPIEKKKILRVIDANFNRAKEGLRVCEDVMRFVVDQPREARQYRRIRHQLESLRSLIDSASKKMLSARSIESDVGKRNTFLEFRRSDYKDIFYANTQRCKESVRVLEEFLKLSNSKGAILCKKLRYSLYALEKNAIKMFSKKMRG